MKPDWAERIYRGRENARQKEQERIIKLLDENLGELDYEDLIQLIKGEEK